MRTTPRNLICTAYLTSRPDPQRGRTVPADCFAYMKPWYDSMRALNLHGVVFHDGLSPEFVADYRTARLHFRRVAPCSWSPNDERFFVYQRFFARRRFSAAFLTDISDVTVVRDPFAGLVRRGWPIVIGDEVYPPPTGRSIRNHGWLMERIRQTRTARCTTVFEFFEERCFDLPTLNAGVIGGTAREIRRFLAAFVRVRRSIGDPRRNLNMPIVNYVFHRLFEGRFHAGAPVTSRFKRFEQPRRDVWFVHK
jgi:hypothetical protein